MARAFIASVPLGIVLVAAVIVPVAVTPGTFGFESWPSSHGAQVTDRPVRTVPRPIEVVKAGPHGNAQTRTIVATTKARAPRTTRATANATPDRHTANLVMTPHIPAPGRHVSHHGSNGSGPGSPPRAPSNPATPSVPAAEPETPTPQPGPGQIAAGDPPVLRPDPVPTPEPPPSPVTPVVPSAPAPAEEDDNCDHGDRRRGPVRDVAHGLGLGRQNGNGHGHGHGHD